MKFLVVWRKLGSLQTAVVEGADAASAYEAFKKSNPGGGVPVNGTLVALEGGVTHIKNSEGKTLVALAAQG